VSRGLRINAHAASDVGRVREGNEDSYFAGATVFAVADGMGGHQAGEIASRTALEPISELDGQMYASAEDAQEALVEAIAAANRAVVAEGDADPELAGMGTTLTAVMVRDGRLHLAHVGDSRAYLLRERETISQLTTDHTLVEQLVRDGRLSREEAATHPQRSVITRAIGVEDDVQVDSLPPIELQPGDQVLLCSDGLTGPVDDTEIAALLDPGTDGDAVCRQLVEAANDAGGPDNITVVLLRVSGSRSTAAAAREPHATEALVPAGEEPATSSDALAADEPNSGGDGRPERPTTRIRTRPESETSDDWADRFGRLGQPQGVDAGPGPRMRRERSGRGGRILAILLAGVLLLGLLAGGGYFLLARSFFVGDLDGEVAIFNGLPDSVGGVPLHWVREADTGVRTDDLPPFRAERVRRGIPADSLFEAREIVETHRQLVEEDDAEDPADEPPGLPDDGADDPTELPGAGDDAGGASTP
jgi:PPM family protein phosphatase